MSEWEIVPAGNITAQRKDAVTLEDGREYRTMGVRWYGKGAYDRGPGSTATIKAKRLFKAHAGDFVFNRIDTQNGAFDVVPPALHGALATNEFPLYVADPDRLLARFLLLYFQQPAVLRQIGALRAGSEGRSRWKEADFEAWPIPLPNLREQRRIVDVMAAVDSQIEALEEEAQRARVALGSLRRELGDIGDKVLLASLAAESGIQIGPFGSQLHAHEYADDGVPVVMPQDIVDGQIVTAKIKRVPVNVAERLKRHRLTEGDVVFPRRGDLGKRALVTAEQDGWLCGTGCLRFRAADPASAARLVEAMAGAQTTEWLVEHAVGTTMLNLNTDILSKLPVADVSSHPELADAAISTIEALRQAMLEHDTLRALRSALLTSLMNQDVEVPESYDALLAPGLEVAS